jgi:tetratricopeptide (TPR) repeat protein
MNSPSKTILSAFRIAAALALLIAAGGFAFAQTAEQAQPAAPAAAAPAAPVAEAPAAVQEAVPSAAQPSAQPAAPDFYADAPAADREILANADALAKAGKWLSAWKALSSYDAAGANPYILSKKIELALDGFAQTTLHTVFGFIDLAEGQDLETIRAEGIAIDEPVEFNPSDLAKAIEAKGEALPPVLSMMLGDFYYVIWLNYQGQWMEEDAAILAKSAEGYERAFAYDTYTAGTLDRQSQILVALERFDAAVSILKKALELEPANDALTLRLADAYFSMGTYAEVFPLVDKVLASSEDSEQLNNAYIAAIKAGLAANDKETLAKYVDSFEKKFPEEYVPGLIRHVVAVQLGDKAAADAAADAVTAAFPGNPDVIRSLISTWLSTEDFDSGFSYLDRAIAKGGTDDHMAALHFYRALLLGEKGQTAEIMTEALAALAKAEEYFKKSYPEGHQVFGMLEELKGQWSAALNAANAPAAAPTAAPAATPPAPETAAPAATPATPETAAPAATAPEATAAPAAAEQAAPAAEADATSAASN